MSCSVMQRSLATLMGQRCGWYLGHLPKRQKKMINGAWPDLALRRPVKAACIAMILGKPGRKVYKPPQNEERKPGK